MPKRTVTFRLWQVLAVFVLVVSAFVVQGILLNAAIKNNESNLVQIQNSRFDSCQLTYQSFPKVFDPFFAPLGQRTKKQAQDIRKFHRVIRHLVKSCRRQVTPPPVTKKVTTTDG